MSKANLTKRQREILEGAQRGETIDAQAKRMGLSPNTVRTHRYAIRNRLDASKYLRYSLAAWGLQ